jgi:hypothetical protein
MHISTETMMIYSQTLYFIIFFTPFNLFIIITLTPFNLFIIINPLNIFLY